MHRTLLSYLIWFLLLNISSAAAKRAFTIEDLYRVRGIEDLHVSPDGKTVLFTLQTSELAKAKRTKHVWLMDVDGKNARQFTFGEKGESSPAFSSDGEWIAFISSRDGDDNLYVISASGGEARRLTNISTGVSDPLWSPDGKWIAFSSDVYPECGADDACNKKIGERWSKRLAARPSGRCAALPPLEGMERREAHPRPAGRRFHRRGARSDAG